ncbi:MAG: hypothetical protein ACI4CT_02075 [Lachnospiraceae bacterium]
MKKTMKKVMAMVLAIAMAVPMMGMSVKATTTVTKNVVLPVDYFIHMKCASTVQTDTEIGYLRGTGNDQSEGAYFTFDASKLNYDKITITSLQLHCDEVASVTSDIWLKLYQSVDGTYQGNNINKNGKSISSDAVVDVTEEGSYIYVTNSSTSFDCTVWVDEFQKADTIGLHLVKTGGSAKPNLSKSNITLTVTYTEEVSTVTIDGASHTFNEGQIVKATSDVSGIWKVNGETVSVGKTLLYTPKDGDVVEFEENADIVDTSIGATDIITGEDGAATFTTAQVDAGEYEIKLYATGDDGKTYAMKTIATLENTQYEFTVTGIPTGMTLSSVVLTK